MADKFMKSIIFIDGGDRYYPLPKVTSADDGKVLKVVNGDWDLAGMVPPLDYLSFIGNEPFTLKTYNTKKNWEGNLEYSTDASNWRIWDGTEISSSNNSLYLRGSENTKINKKSSPSGRFVFTGTDSLKISCTGNIENLLDCEIVNLGEHPTMDKSCFAYLFSGCTSLKTAPTLPATTLKTYCYQSMFSGCTSLKTAPTLPATTLVTSCYQSMFEGCTALTTAPSLLATTLKDYCYRSMFEGCTSLTTAPTLPASTIAQGCYKDMFNGCASLETLPELPATTLKTYCYKNMFEGCTRIRMSKTKTGEYTTPYRVPKSGTGTSASFALDNMFMNTGGSFASGGNGTPTINTTYYTSNALV